MRPIYLDYNATTPIAPKVQEAMLPFIAEQFGNPLSDHVLGRSAAQAIEDARHRVAKAIGAEADEIYFTANATEACRRAVALQPERPVATRVDHAAVREPVEHQGGFLVAPDARGRVDPAAIDNATADGLSLASVVHANNEIGTLQPVEKVNTLMQEWGVATHSDASQSLGKVPVDVGRLGVDLLTLSGHKAYGPKGVGALFARRGTHIGETFNLGTTLSPGMPDVAAIVGFGHAAELAASSVEASAPRMAALRDRLLGQLREGADQELIVWGEAAERLPNTLAIAFPGVAGDELLAACPEICATALGSGSGEAVKLSPTLRAIEADAEEARGTLRLSVGWYTTEEEIDRAASLLLDAWERLREE